MEIGTTVQPAKVAAAQLRPSGDGATVAGSPAPEPAPATPSTAEMAEAAQARPSLEQSLKQALRDLEVPDLPLDSFRLELDFNQDAGRVVARVLDKGSGELLREIPSKELQQLFAHMREFLGSLVDEQA